MKLLDPRDFRSKLSHAEALAVARERHGRTFRVDERVCRSTRPLPVILNPDRDGPRLKVMA